MATTSNAHDDAGYQSDMTDSFVPDLEPLSKAEATRLLPVFGSAPRQAGAQGSRRRAREKFIGMQKGDLGPVLELGGLERENGRIRCIRQQRPVSGEAARSVICLPV